MKSVSNVLRTLLPGSKSSTARTSNQQRPRRLNFEPLEERQLLSVNPLLPKQLENDTQVVMVAASFSQDWTPTENFRLGPGVSRLDMIRGNFESWLYGWYPDTREYSVDVGSQSSSTVTLSIDIDLEPNQTIDKSSSAYVAIGVARGGAILNNFTASINGHLITEHKGVGWDYDNGYNAYSGNSVDVYPVGYHIFSFDASWLSSDEPNTIIIDSFYGGRNALGQRTLHQPIDNLVQDVFVYVQVADVKPTFNIKVENNNDVPVTGEKVELKAVFDEAIPDEYEISSVKWEVINNSTPDTREKDAINKGKVEWTGIASFNEGVFAGGYTMEYDPSSKTVKTTFLPKLGQHGEKIVTCQITLKHKETGETITLEAENYDVQTPKKGFRLQLFFEHDAKNTSGIPNWFTYWGEDGAVPRLNETEYRANLSGIAEFKFSGTVLIGPDAGKGTNGGKDKYGNVIHNGTGGLVYWIDFLEGLPRIEYYGGVNSDAIHGLAAIVAHEFEHKKLFDNHPQFSSVKGDLYISYEERDFFAKIFGYEVGTQAERLSLEERWDDLLLEYRWVNNDYVSSAEERDGYFPDTWNVLTDTWDIVSGGTGVSQWNNGSDYLYYGDNELRARLVEKATLDARIGVEENDWSNKGSQAAKKQGVQSTKPQPIPAVQAFSMAASVEKVSKTPEILLDNYATIREETGIALFALAGITYSDAGIDTNGNTKFDELVISVTLDIPQDGNYAFSADLFGANDFPLTKLFVEMNLTAGTHTIDLHFDGRVLGTLGIDGPYELDLRVYDDKADIIEGGVAVHTTQAYKASDFEQMLDVTIVDETTADTNDNGLYDTLTITTEIVSPATGTYSLGGYLYSSTGELVTYVVFSHNLEDGLNQVDFVFRGLDISFSKQDGPYSLSISSFIGKDGVVFSGDNIHQTAPYLHTEFEGAQASFSGTFSDHGTADALTIEVGVNVVLPGSYELVAYLDDADGNFAGYSSVITTLDVGQHTISLDFDIQYLMSDGPWTLSWVMLRDAGTDTMLGSLFNAYMTTDDDALPDAPTNFAVAATHNSATLTWTASDRATAYVLQYKKATDTTWTTTSSSTGASATITGLSTDTAYNFRIKATNVDGESEWVYQNATTKAAPGEQETPSTIVTTQDDSVDVYDGLISLREAIAYANPGDTITFAENLWGKTIILNGSELYIDKNITIDASGMNITIDAAEGSRIFNIAYGTTVTLAGLTITGGFDYYGGGIYNSGTLTITNNTITGNSAVTYGGGIYNIGTLTVTDCTITGNSTAYGGGIFNTETGMLTVTDTMISENSAQSWGGGIDSRGTLVLTNSTITKNSAIEDGAGIENWGNLTVTNSTITENTAWRWGGGIDNWNDTTIVTNSIIAGNTAGEGGGIYNNDDYFLTVTNSMITDNYATSSGGGIYAGYSSTVAVTNCTIAGNSADADGDGISNRGTMVLFNTIVAEEIYRVSGTFQGFNSLTTFAYWGDNSGDNLVYDPARPLFVDAAGGDYRLAEGSQAINMGNNDYATTEFDLAGKHRIIGGIIDIGAYEYDGVFVDPPSAPEDFISPSQTTDSVTLTWTASTDATGYVLQYQKATDRTWVTAPVPTGTIATIGGLSANTVYNFRIQATITNSSSAWVMTDATTKPMPLPSGTSIIALAADAGPLSQPIVQVYDAVTEELLFEITADRTFGVDYTGGVRVATGDLDGDGVPDIIVVPGRNMAPSVLVFSGIDGSKLEEYCIPASATYGLSFKDGLNVAVGDVTGTGTNDIILVPSGGQAVVKVFENITDTASGTFGFANQPARQFNAFEDYKQYIGGGSIAVGVTETAVAAADHSQIVIGTGAGISPIVRVFDVKTNQTAYTAIREVKSVRPDVLGGVNVAVGDLTGNGFNELVIASRNAGQSWVDIYTLAPQKVSEHVAGFQAFGPTEGNNVAVNLVVRDTDGDGLAEIIVTQGARGKAGFVARKFQVKSSLETKIVDEIFAEWSNPLATGLFIG